MGITEITGAGMSYYVPQIPRVNPMPQQQDNEQKINPATTPDYSQNTIDTSNQPPKRPVAELEDISLTFNKNDTFDQIGSESDLGSLDIGKAISDMKKDKIFEEYQYFVGSASNLGVNAQSDGMVVIKQAGL